MKGHERKSICNLANATAIEEYIMGHPDEVEDLVRGILKSESN